jgi:uroporphyrinogen-III synthase
LAKTRQLDTTRAIQAKSATALLPLIVENTGTSTGPLLLIRGDKSTNELQNGLRQAKREYIETIVYATTCRHSLEDDIKTLLDTVRGEGQDGDDIWLAFFSPSSAEMVLEYMRSHTENGGTGGTKEGIWSKVKIGAIGETTAQFLQDRNLEVEAVAKEPTADGMASAVQACSREL